MSNCYADLETESESELKGAGARRYAEHPSTEIQLFSYAFGDGPVKVWNRKEGEPMPDDLKSAFENPSVVFIFHNAWFDRNVIENVLGIYLPIQRYRCSMAMALSHGLPGALDKLGEALGIREDYRKMKDGKRLVQLFCKPKKMKDGTLVWATPQTHPQDWATYIEYCRTDTASMREVIKKIPKWNYPAQANELELWYMDQTVNSRGMAIDLEFANAAMLAIEDAQKELAKEAKRRTGGAVEAASQRDKLLEHILAEYGYDLPNMQKAAITKLVDDESIPQPLRELLQNRLSTCTTSTSKYKALVRATSKNGRLHGTVQFAGASRTLRDCLAEGSLILVLTEAGMVEEKPIETVELSDKVWDGVEWVEHLGVEFRGVKEVIEHDGVCATPDHVVYLEDGISVRLEEAKAKGLGIWSAPI